MVLQSITSDKPVRKQRGLLDAIFWRLHTSYILNRQSDSQRYLAMLLDSGKESEIFAEIGYAHVSRFKHMKANIENKAYSRFYGGSYDVSDAVGSVLSESDIKERDYCKNLMAARQTLFAVIGASNYSLMLAENEVGQYGRVDFVVKDGRIMHVVEVKMGEAPCSVLEQVSRYRIAMELDFCLGLFDEVKGWVLAEKFSDYVVSELSRNGIGMIVHDGKDGLRLVRDKNLISCV